MVTNFQQNPTDTQRTQQIILLLQASWKDVATERKCPATRHKLSAEAQVLLDPGDST